MKVLSTTAHTHWWPALILLLAVMACRAQVATQPTGPAPSRTPTETPADPSSEPSEITPSDALPDSLPDSPGAVQARQYDVVAVAEASFKVTGDGARPCRLFSATKVIYVDPTRYDQLHKPCAELIYPYQRFLNTNVAIPLNWQQKGYLALHDLTDPANFATIVGISAISIGANSHTAYGPGLEGFGTIAGISLLQDATGQFFGVFAIPALIHQDPRYYRMPNAPLRKRFFYSISRTFVARSDNGSSMPNYAALLTYPITAELANLYVPGIRPNGESTVTRSLTGIATDPANNLLTEFLPDVAKRIHVRIIFVQTLLNNMASGANGVNLQ